MISNQLANKKMNGFIADLKHIKRMAKYNTNEETGKEIFELEKYIKYFYENELFGSLYLQEYFEDKNLKIEEKIELLQKAKNELYEY